jgi:hypothetical protein
MTTVQIQGNNVQEFLDLARNKFKLKVKVLDSYPSQTNKWDVVDKQLKSSEVVNEKLKNDFLALTSTIKSKLSKSYTAKKAKEEYFMSQR